MGNSLWSLSNTYSKDPESEISPPWARNETLILKLETQETWISNLFLVETAYVVFYQLSISMIG